MIEAIKNFLQIIVDSVTTLWTFLVSLFQDIVYVISALATFLTRIRRYLGFLPLAVYVVFAVGISIAIVYKIVGRDG